MTPSLGEGGQWSCTIYYFLSFRKVWKFLLQNRVQPASKMAPNDPFLLLSLPFCLPIVHQGWSMWPSKHSWSDSMSPPRLSYKRLQLPSWTFYLLEHSFSGGSHVVSSPVAHMTRKWNLCKQRCEWAWSESSSPRQVFRDCSPSWQLKDQARST